MRSARIDWKEDVRVWHPGQEWIWEPGGFGVFDPGINALSILTEIMPQPVRVTAAALEVPENRATPIAARLDLVDSGGAPVIAEFDFRQTGAQSWDIAVTTGDGTLLLAHGGNAIAIDGAPLDAQTAGVASEYAGLYIHFMALVADRAIDVDVAPLRLVADAYLAGRNHDRRAIRGLTRPHRLLLRAQFQVGRRARQRIAASAELEPARQRRWPRDRGG